MQEKYLRNITDYANMHRSFNHENYGTDLTIEGCSDAPWLTGKEAILRDMTVPNRFVPCTSITFNDNSPVPFLQKKLRYYQLQYSYVFRAVAVCPIKPPPAHTVVNPYEDRRRSLGHRVGRQDEIHNDEDWAPVPDYEAPTHNTMYLRQEYLRIRSLLENFQLYHNFPMHVLTMLGEYRVFRRDDLNQPKWWWTPRMAIQDVLRKDDIGERVWENEEATQQGFRRRWT